jgi:DNA-binding LacI/PurR family transcriptional regulator
VLQRLLDDERVRGLLVAPNTDTEHAQDVIQWLADCGAPSVLMERDARLLPCREPAESVTTDHAHGGALAARHFAELGHRRVGLVLSRNSPTSRKIAVGWHAACAEIGLAQAEGFEPLLPDRSSPEFSASINAALDTALDAGLTALLVHSDPEAMAVIDLALNRGVSVPGDLSVASYDDEVAQLFSPALTAVCPPRTALGEAALDLLADRIADPDRPPRRVILSPHLNVRDSTAPPR